MKTDEKILALCIPTHHGRRSHLAELIESILAEISTRRLQEKVHVYVSDNASADGTEDYCKALLLRHPTLFTYKRHDRNTGIMNFFHVVNMSSEEYCWILGSDDAIIPSGIERVLSSLEKFPAISGITVNKINFDKDLRTLVGKDHDQVLPTDYQCSREMRGSHEILANLFMCFCFISANIFKKSEWQRIAGKDSEALISRHPYFPHVHICTQIALENTSWYWLSEYCVAQRLDNFTFTTATSSRGIDYAEHLTEDLISIALQSMSSDPLLLMSIKSRIFFSYWNPWFALRYSAQAVNAIADIRRAKVKCKNWFKDIPFFWSTTYLVLSLPTNISYIILQAATQVHSVSVRNRWLHRPRMAARWLLHKTLQILSVERKANAPDARFFRDANVFLEWRNLMLYQQESSKPER